MSKGALAHRIEVLEARLAASLAEDVPSAAERSEQPPALPAPPFGQKSTHAHFDGFLRFLTLSNEGNGEQKYLGPSSGLSIADAVGTKLLPINSNQQPEATLQHDKRVMASPPSDEDGLRILEAYFTHMHARLPFLDRVTIIDSHTKRHQPSTQTPEDEFEKFKLFMVYAIGATILQMTGSSESTPPNDFLLTALSFDPTLRESISMTSIEAMMLLVIYHLRSSSHPSVWYMIGLAMRTCIDFGLHREARYQKLRPHQAESRKRLFWSVYIIERYTAWSLGRPFSIAEEDIDVQSPLNIDDSITDDGIIDQYLQSQLGTETPQPKGTMSRFVASVGLQRIVSQIHTRIYRVDKKVTSLFPEIAPLMSALDGFKETLRSLDLDDGDFVHMHLNNVVRMLIQPFLSILDPQDELISTCMASSGKMCQFSKSLRQRDFSGYSYLLVNSVFMAGLTMCFCLFRSPSLWTPSVSNDLRACSSSLFVMAERNHRLKKHRDVLEAIITKAMEYVQGAARGFEPSSTMISQEGLTGFQILDTPSATEQPFGLSGVGDYEARIDFSSGEFDSYMTNLLSELPGFPSSLPNEQLGNPETQSHLHGVFTQEFWATDVFNQPMLDGFGWTI